MSRFDFRHETFPVWVENDSVDPDTIRDPGFTELVDSLMNLMGWDRDQAEARAVEILEDDAA